MSLPTRTADQAGGRSLELRCESPHSAHSKHTVALLSEKLSECKESFLYSAVFMGRSNLVRCALEAGASADSRASENMARPVLVEAAYKGHTRILKQLLEAGADRNLTDRQGFTALTIAALEGRLDCIELLLAAGADANVGDEIGNTPLITAVTGKHTDCAKALLPASDLRIRNRAGRTAFLCCIMTASEECFELLLPHVNDVNAECTVAGVLPKNGETVPVFHSTPLHMACQWGQHRMAKALLKRGADRTARDSWQRMPLVWTAHNGHLACSVLLLGQPGRYKMTASEVNAADESGFTALHAAAWQGFEKICGVLLEAGARLDAKAIYGFTPLMIAQQEHPTNAALHALLAGGGPAQPPGTVCDHCGKTAAQASVNNLKACSQCQAVRYCGAACSVAAWPGHKAACKARAAERAEITKPMRAQL
jgi:ankyrin repeat protein